MARRLLGRKLAGYAIAALLIAWPIVQIVHTLGTRTPSQDADKMLYQVSLFELELLTNDLNETASARNTSELNGLKQAAYSFAYAHERLTKVTNDGHLAKLDSVDELLQVIMRLQLGGERPLKPAETDLLRSLQQPFATLYDAYGKLLTPSGAFIASQEDKTMKADQTTAELIRKKSLQ